MLQNKSRILVAMLIASAAPSAFAQTTGADDGAAERHGISRIVPIVLHDGVNFVLNFIQDKYEGAIVTACSPAGGRLYAITHPVETGFTITHPDGTTEPEIVQEPIPIHDVLSGQLLNTIESHAAQKVAFMRARLAGADTDDVILVTGARAASAPRTDSQVQFQIYRYQAVPIIDGLIETFEPVMTWQSEENYQSASQAMERAFGITLPEDEDRLCARAFVGARPRP